MSKRGKLEYEEWQDVKYPYDMAECVACATQHAQRSCCNLPAHKEMRKEARKLGLSQALILSQPAKARRLALAFREKFARFYPIA
jgi:hypothetical protein